MSAARCIGPGEQTAKRRNREREQTSFGPVRTEKRRRQVLSALSRVETVELLVVDIPFVAFWLF